MQKQLVQVRLLDTDGMQPVAAFALRRWKQPARAQRRVSNPCLPFVSLKPPRTSRSAISWSEDVGRPTQRISFLSLRMMSMAMSTLNAS